MVPTVSFTTATMSMSKSCRGPKSLQHHKGATGVKTEKARQHHASVVNPTHSHRCLEVEMAAPSPPTLCPIRTTSQTAARTESRLLSSPMSHTTDRLSQPPLCSIPPSWQSCQHSYLARRVLRPRTEGCSLHHGQSYQLPINQTNLKTL